MHSLAYQHNTGIHPGAMINRAQAKAAPDHEKIRDAVRAWSSALDNQDVVSALIINEYREQGGTAISFPEDISRARQKLFRFLDNRFDSEQYRENVRQLTPAIMSVLPLEYLNQISAARLTTFSDWKVISDTARGDLTNIITDAVARGVNPRETASVISKRLDVSMSKAKTIAQTEQVGALRQAQWNETDWAADRLGLNTGLLWLSALKPTTRTWHASRHGKVYTTEEVRDFYAENGNRYNCYCSQIPVLLNDDGSIFNEGLTDKLAAERKQWAKAA